MKKKSEIGPQDKEVIDVSYFLKSKIITKPDNFQNQPIYK
jgi:hypothetical protein